MNLRQLIDQFRVEADDKRKPYHWDDAFITNMLNEAENEACIRQKLIREKVDTTICRIDVRANVSVYNLDSRVIDITYASMINAGSTGMLPYILGSTTPDELDQWRPQWRALVKRPEAIICHDRTIELDCRPDASYTISLEANRLPLSPLKQDNDCPEINSIHHRHLVKWVLFRAYAVQDGETEDLARSEKHEAEFDQYFGKRPDANMRRRQRASRPHRNRAW